MGHNVKFLSLVFQSTPTPSLSLNNYCTGPYVQVDMPLVQQASQLSSIFYRDITRSTEEIQEFKPSFYADFETGPGTRA